MRKKKLGKDFDDSDLDELYEEDEEKHFKAPKGDSPKGKHKGHQSRHSKKDQWAEYDENMEEIAPPRPRAKTALLGAARMAAENRPTTHLDIEEQPSERKFTFGPNSHEVKGNMIDFDRVLDIQKVESVHNGRNTYGIKFLFVGKKGLYRIAWFNQNMKDRDAVYEKELSYWKSLTSQ